MMAKKILKIFAIYLLFSGNLAIAAQSVDTVNSAATPAEKPIQDQLAALKANSEVVKPKPATHGYSKMLLGLVLVLALVFVVAWLLKRISPASFSSSRCLKLESVLALGGKEKVAVISVEERRLLVGITPQSIQLLTELSAVAEKDGGDNELMENSSFAQQVKKLLKQESGNVSAKL